MDKGTDDNSTSCDADYAAAAGKRPAKSGKLRRKEIADKKFEDQLDALALSIPRSVLKQFPTDLSRNFEHYMYGARKK